MGNKQSELQIYLKMNLPLAGAGTSSAESPFWFCWSAATFFGRPPFFFAATDFSSLSFSGTGESGFSSGSAFRFLPAFSLVGGDFCGSFVATSSVSLISRQNEKNQIEKFG